MLNLFLGLMLWFFFSTDYSFFGIIIDLLFPPATAIFALISYRYIRRNCKLKRPRLVRLPFLPSIIGGGYYVLVGVLMFIPPFTLAALFTISEIGSETEIQRAISPDTSRTAHVLFRATGSYTGGLGRTYVRVRHKYLPLLERDIYHVSRSNASGDTANYIEWRDNDTIYIPETAQEISVGRINTEVPPILVIPVSLFQMIRSTVVDLLESQQQAAAVKDVPIYPGNITNNLHEYRDFQDTAYRSFHIQEEDADSVAKWYEQELSEPPWTLIDVNSYLESEKNVEYYGACIHAMREFEGQQQDFWWEIMGRERSDIARVNIGSPNPISDTCGRYAGSPR